MSYLRNLYRDVISDLQDDAHMYVISRCYRIWYSNVHLSYIYI